MIDWLLPATGFVVATGLLGVTSKVAMRHAGWPELLVWSALACVVIGACLLATGTAFEVGSMVPLALLNGAMAMAALALLFTALGTGDASRVIPISAAYPGVSVLAAALLIGEPLTVARVGGTALIVTGIILVSTESRWRRQGSKTAPEALPQEALPTRGRTAER